jgi:hypothetical protein
LNAKYFTPQTILPKPLKELGHFSGIAAGKVKTRTIIYGGGDRHGRADYAVKAEHLTKTQ